MARQRDPHSLLYLLNLDLPLSHASGLASRRSQVACLKQNAPVARAVFVFHLHLQKQSFCRSGKNAKVSHLKMQNAIVLRAAVFVLRFRLEKLSYFTIQRKTKMPA
jgi:hypothetical protein